MSQGYAVVGRPVPRAGLRDKVTGRARFTADIKLPGMLHASVLRSPHPHAEVLAVDASEAEAMPGVRAVLTPFDEASRRRVAADMPVLDTVVRYVGDEVAAVAAEDEDTAQAALGSIKVTYRRLPFVLDPEEAMGAHAPRLHPDGNLWQGKPMVLARGDVDAGFAEADLVLEGTYRVPSHSGAALEPRAALAAWDGDSLTVWKTSRGVHMDRAALAAALGFDEARVRVVGPPMGGGYGNKDEGRAGVIAALLARRAGRPVRLEFSREEEFISGRTRHAAVITLRVGVTRGGSVTAISNRTVLNTGAYLASGPGVLRRTAQASLYLYRCANVRYEGHLVYTNGPVAGSYRALGAPQGHYALEVHMDRVAEALGLDPLEFRLRNHVGVEGQPGQRVTPSADVLDTQPVEGGVPFSSNGLRECLLRGAEAIGWRRDGDSPAAGGPRDPSVRRGTGVAMCIYRGGPGGRSSARVAVRHDGVVDLATGVMDVGEGAQTALAQVAAEALGCRYEDVTTVAPDTASTPQAPITAGSTVTFSTGLAVQRAAAEVRKRLLELATTRLEAPTERLAVRDGRVFVVGDPSRGVSIAELAATAPPGALEAAASVVPGSREYVVNSFAAHFATVQVDVRTGRVQVLRYVAVHDSGRIINPHTATNQVEGGVGQMLGFALTEQMVTDGPSGVTLNGSFMEHGPPTIADVPPVEVLFVETDDPVGPFGAKALGEPPSVPVAAAVANAIHAAIGVRFCELPVTPDKVVQAVAAGVKVWPPGGALGRRR